MALTEKMTSPQLYLRAQTRWRPIEIAFWLATLLPYVLFPNYLSLASQIAISALFALSLDLILGYAGIVSLGHAAFFGVGAYTAGLASKYGWGEPLTGLAMAALAAGIVGYATSFVICRFRHLALIMLTTGFGLLLAELANSLGWLTGGMDGLQGIHTWKLARLFPLRSVRHDRLQLCAGRAVCVVPVLPAADPFAIRPVAARHSRKLRPHARDRRAEPIPHAHHLHHRGGYRRHCRRAAWRRPRKRCRSIRSASSAPPKSW